MGRNPIPRARGSSMAEAAVTLPVVLLTLMLAINASLAAYCAAAAADAANYGARLGAVARTNPGKWAMGGVESALRRSGAPGSFEYSVQVQTKPGGVSSVVVAWRYPTLFSGLCPLFGKGCPEYFEGSASSMWKKEGW